MLAIWITEFTYTTEPEEVQSNMSVPLQHAPYETVYQLGKHFEVFKKDKGKKLLIECAHTDEDKVEITSKCQQTQKRMCSFMFFMQAK